MLIWEDVVLGKRVSYLFNNKKILLLEAENSGGRWSIKENTFLSYLIEERDFNTLEDLQEIFYINLRALISTFSLGIKNI
jgi:hypothetical protein